MGGTPVGIASDRLLALMLAVILTSACGSDSATSKDVPVSSAPSAASQSTSTPSPRDDPAHGQTQGDTTQSAPVAPPVVTSTPVSGDKQGQPSVPNPADPVNMKLIPYKGEVGFSIRVPDGWKVQPTALGDLVRFYSKSDPVDIFVRSTQLRGAAVPHTVEEMKRSIASVAPNADVKAVQVSGAQTAFEVMYKKKDDQGELAYLERYMFGSTRRQVLRFTVPTEAYPQWEPVFRQIIQSFQPMNLDAGEMPGRP